ncbi:MAG: response regulator [Algicola sp.]|nr:response regulator [Algicola sp.]
MGLSVGKKILGGFGFAVALFSFGTFFGVSQLPNPSDGQTLLLITAVVVVLALLVGLGLSWHITARLRVVLNGLKAFDAGLLNHPISADSDDELGQLMGLLATVIDTQLKVTEAISQIASGDLGRTLGVKNEQDLLSSSLNQLVNTLNDTAQQATFIASGNYEVDIQPRSQNDSLGLALQNMTKTLRDASQVIESIAEGDLTLAVEIKGQQDVLARSINRMVAKLRESTLAIEARGWINAGNTQLVERIQGELTTQAIATAALDQICLYTTAQIGTFYLYDQQQEQFSLVHSHAVTDCQKILAKDQGFIGQAARDRKTMTLDNLPENYLNVTTSLGQASPSHVIVVPLMFNDLVSGVIELAGLNQFTEETLTLLEQQAISIAAAIQVSQARETTAILLQETQAQAQKLQQQRQTLQTTNATLKEKQASLATSKNEIEIKARELALTSKYKSEFLANMSHELRTPLNSLLILSKTLAENKQGNLTADQVEEATIVHQGGQSLLLLINDIMDLSKVEAGMLDIYPEAVSTRSVWQVLETLFTPVAMQKGLAFSHDIQSDLPLNLQTDCQRLQQILKNLLSNAFKFTAQGTVTLRIHAPAPDCQFVTQLNAKSTIGFSVTDTGVGIPKGKFRAIFEAFQQADGSTSRQYGGTGLGLTISRELASLLGGEIQLTSEEHLGSTFTLYLPIEWQGTSLAPQRRGPPHSQPTTAIAEFTPTPIKRTQSTTEEETQVAYWLVDDRRHIRPNDRTVLIIEDDHTSASLMVNLCHQLSLKVLVTNKGREGIMMSIEYAPSCILLDMGLPDIEGHQVLTQLKDSLHTRHIPVVVLTAAMQAFESLNLGAHDYLSKPVSNDTVFSVLSALTLAPQDPLKQVLVLVSDTQMQQTIDQQLCCDTFKLNITTTIEQAINLLSKQNFDCIVIEFNQPDSHVSAITSAIDELNIATPPAVVVYCECTMTEPEQQMLDELSRKMIIRVAHTPHRLLDDVTLFLHLPSDALNSEQRHALQQCHNEDYTIKGSRILLVDDDMRNMFALTRVLESNGLNITQAENGQAAIDALKQTDVPFDLILMDIMMPIMDGYEAMQLIRQMPVHQSTPIIALTAKAMPIDRQKCIAAGASEYQTKPLDTDKLLLMLRVWLYKRV